MKKPNFYSEFKIVRKLNALSKKISVLYSGERFLYDGHTSLLFKLDMPRQMENIYVQMNLEKLSGLTVI